MTVDFTNNANQRTPCVLVLDASTSMMTRFGSTTGIEALNQGLIEFEQALKNDDMAVSRVQVAIVVVGGPTSSAEIMMDWTDADVFDAFPLTAGGNTPLGEGLILGLEMIEIQKRNIQNAGISYTRPWMIVMSDGSPTSSSATWDDAISQTTAAAANKKAIIYTIGVEGADMEVLNQISDTPAENMSTVKYNEFFQWLSDSLSAASQSRPGDTISLPDTNPWRNVGI